MKRGFPPSNAIISEKTQACLEMAEALHCDDKNRHTNWKSLYAAACLKFSEKAINRKFEELFARDYIDYGVSVRTGWLTDRGRAVLSLCRYQDGLKNPVPDLGFPETATQPR